MFEKKEGQGAKNKNVALGSTWVLKSQLGGNGKQKGKKGVSTAEKK